MQNKEAKVPDVYQTQEQMTIMLLYQGIVNQRLGFISNI